MEKITGLHPSCETPEEAASESDREKILQKALGAAIKLLSRRIHTVEELKNRLLKQDVSEDILPDVIAECLRRKYLNDETVAKYYLDELRRKSYGPRYIRQYMRQKGLESDLIEEIFEQYQSEYDESDIARRAYHKKSKMLGQKESPQKRREKIHRYLCSRGFSMSVISELIRQDFV